MVYRYAMVYHLEKNNGQIWTRIQSLTTFVRTVHCSAMGCAEEGSNQRSSDRGKALVFEVQCTNQCIE